MSNNILFNKQDPWGGGRGSGGPPDLDLVFKKFQERVFGAFGKGGGSGAGDDGGDDLPLKGGLLLFGAVVVLYVASGFFIVQPAEQAVITRFGKYERTVGEGPHWSPRFIESRRILNTEELTSSRHSGWMLTKDENIIYAEIELQFRILDPQLYLFKVENPRLVLKEAADSALRQVIGESLMDDVLTKEKESIAQSIKEYLTQILDSYDIGILIATVNFKDSRPPEQVKDAFDDVTKSREDKEKLILQAEAYRNKILPEAEGRARRIIEEAESYKQEAILGAEGQTAKFNLVLPEYRKAPAITKKRLYIETMTKVLSGTSKVLIDVDAGNHLLYLPIDKLMGSTANRAAANSSEFMNNNSQLTTPARRKSTKFSQRRSDADDIPSRRRKG